MWEVFYVKTGKIIATVDTEDLAKGIAKYLRKRRQSVDYDLATSAQG